MRIFLSARYGRQKEIREHAADLERMGHVITSCWIKGDHEAAPVEAAVDSLPVLDSCRLAQEDLVDLINSDVLINFTEKPSSPHGRGGRHVEFGFAMCMLRLHQLKAVIVLGPRENVFHALPGVLYHHRWSVPMVNLMLKGLEHPFHDLILKERKKRRFAP